MSSLAKSPLNPFRVSWNRHTREQWDAMLAACHRASLTQSAAYALALNDVSGQKADMGVIRFNDRPIGLVVAQGKPFLGTPGSQTIYRGPSWTHAEIPGEMQRLALEMLRRRYRLRKGRPLTFHPELADTPAHRTQLLTAGFKRVAEGYRTI